jgi:hypothetical protein
MWDPRSRRVHMICDVRWLNIRYFKDVSNENGNEMENSKQHGCKGAMIC